MLTIFDGWRRKVGLALLGLSLLFFIGWVRSLSRCDLMNLRTTLSSAELVLSDPAGITWVRLKDSDEQLLIDTDVVFNLPVDVRKNVLESFAINWSFEWFGFKLGQGRELLKGWGGANDQGVEQMLPNRGAPSVATFLILPYAPVIASLTLFSGWLLLNKSRRSNPLAISD